LRQKFAHDAVGIRTEPTVEGLKPVYVRYKFSIPRNVTSLTVATMTFGTILKAANDKYMEITPTPRAGAGLARVTCDFWDSLPPMDGYPTA
jgi:hypothetical protein